MKTECLPTDHVDVVENSMQTGDIYVEKNKIIATEEHHTKARSYYEKALIIYCKSEHRNTAYILNSIGSIYENIP